MPEQNSQRGISPELIAERVSNVSQVGGIETSVIDNGAGRGVRIAWINTGSGLRYKVVIDRALDIADTFFNQHSIAWISSKGITPPQVFPAAGLDWLQAFTGGLLTTCGLSHVGPPEKDEYGERGLHGMISNCAAEIGSIIQPDPSRGQMEMSISGIVRESKIFGPSLELKRSISSTLGRSSLTIRDEVSNRGNQTVPHMLLYHFNFGWPFIDEGTELIWKGQMHVPENSRREIFNDQNNYHLCPPPMNAHKGTGEEVAFFDVTTDENGNAVCGAFNKKIGVAVQMTYSKKNLPWLTNWQHWGHGEYVTGIEPGTHPPIGQAKARKENQLIFIEPGETRRYEIQLEVLQDANSINEFLKYK